MILNVKYIMFLNPQLQYRIKDTISGLNIVLKRKKSMNSSSKSCGAILLSVHFPAGCTQIHFQLI